MSHDNDDTDLDKTTTSSHTVKIKINADYRVPPCIVLLVGPAELVSKQWLLDKPILTIGRASTNDVHISDVSLSKAHARIEFADGRVTVTDLESTNGTMIEGKKLEPLVKYALKNNDQIQVANLVFKFLERGILSETTEKARMQSELEQARRVQGNLFPNNAYQTYQWIQVGGVYLSASECGGDWWWHFSISDKVFAILGDATGHGAGAALITSAARSAIAAIETDPTVTIEKVYTTLSHAVRVVTGGRLAMSAFIVEVSTRTKKLRYINASHLPAVFLPKYEENLNWKKLKLFDEPTSPALGPGEGAPRVGEYILPKLSRIVLLSDGITERVNKDGVATREGEFFQMLVKTHAQTLHDQKGFLEALISESDAQTGKAALADDITVVALDFNE